VKYWSDGRGVRSRKDEGGEEDGRIWDTL